MDLFLELMKYEIAALKQLREQKGFWAYHNEGTPVLERDQKTKIISHKENQHFKLQFYSITEIDPFLDYAGFIRAFQAHKFNRRIESNSM